jgi:hypothetical protein
MPLISNMSLSIDGQTISLVNDRVTINEITTYERNAPSRLTFAHEAVLPANASWTNKQVDLTINGNIVFTGRIRDRQPILDETRGYTYAYQAQGWEYHGNDIPVVSPFDGTGTITFNLGTTDTNYDPTYAGKTLGEMIRIVLEQEDTRASLQANRLGRYTSTTANGITTWSIDSRTVSDLTTDAYLSAFRPTKSVTFEGDSLFDSIRGVLQNLAPNHVTWIEYEKSASDPNNPNSAPQTWGIIRFSDTRSRVETKTLTIGDDPAPQLRRDYSNSFSRVVIKGGPNIQPVLLDKKNGDLVENFAVSPWYANNTAAKAAWNLSVWTKTEGQTVTGTALCRRPRTANEANSSDPAYIADPGNAVLADPNWLYVDPSQNNLTWANNAWNQNSSAYQGFLYVTRTSNSTWQQLVNRQVVSNTNLTANGKSYLQLNEPLPNTNFNNFTMVARNWPGLQTWRRYLITANTSEGKPIGRYAQPAFPTKIPWLKNDGTPLSFVESGIAQVQYSSSGNEPYQNAMCGFQIDRSTQSLIFDKPLVMFFGDQTSLNTGGANVTGQPSNIRVLLPVSTSALTVTVPADTTAGNVTTANYNGTSSTIDGINRTMYVNYSQWISEDDKGIMSQWGREILDSVKDTVIEGTAYRYSYDPVFRPCVGMAFVDPCHANNPLADYTTDIVGSLVKFNHGQNGEILYHTEYALSNKRAQYRGFEGYLHPHILDLSYESHIEKFKGGIK